MTKLEVISKLAENTGLSKKDAKIVVNAFGDIVLEHIKDEGGVVPFDGLKLTTKLCKGRTGTNPRTGEKFEIPERVLPVARFGQRFKEFTA